jgi:hypothetical protein
MNTSASKMECESSAVATIVSRSTEYLGLLAGQVAREMRGYRIETGLGGRLHQQKGGGLIIASREAVNLAHLLG